MKANWVTKNQLMGHINKCIVVGMNIVCGKVAPLYSKGIGEYGSYIAFMFAKCYAKVFNSLAEYHKLTVRMLLPALLPGLGPVIHPGSPNNWVKIIPRGGELDSKNYKRMSNAQKYTRTLVAHSKRSPMGSLKREPVTL